jgi:DTW domain-containing protein YfiP
LAITFTLSYAFFAAKFKVIQYLMLNVWLLTHSRETFRLNNTGQVVLKALVSERQQPDKELLNVHRVIWDRVVPCSHLISSINEHPSVLLYPSTQQSNTHNISIKDYLLTLSQSAGSDDNHELNIVLLDATWQEARKMYNKSAYLQQLYKIALTPTFTSQYRLRRNQQELGLCTAEAVIEILKMAGYLVTETKLQVAFELFLEEAKDKEAQI